MRNSKSVTMPRRSKKRSKNDNVEENGRQAGQHGNSVASHVRDRQRAVAEREAARLARPEASRRSILAHANRKLSAVSSTPFGFLATNSGNIQDEAENEGWCGPFSVARRMIANREIAKRKREEELAGEQEEHHPLDGLMNELDDENQRKIHPSMQWKSNLTNDCGGGISNNKRVVVRSTYAKRKRRVDLSKSDKSRIPSLFQLTVNFIVDNFEYVESLGDVGNEVRVAIAKELVARNQLDGKALKALVEPAIETLEIIDCAGIDHESMASCLANSTALRYLLLTHAGWCFGTKSVKALVEMNKGAELCCLSIAGAYLLRDDDAAKIINAHDSTLQSIAFQSCPLLGNNFVNTMQQNPKLGENLLELSLQDMSFSADQLSILAKSNNLRKIKSLTLKSISGLTNEILATILETANGMLDSLDISFNYLLTDSTLSSIRQFNSTKLKTLILDGIKGITPQGLEALFTHPLEGLPPPPKLKVLKVASIDHEAVTDGLLRLVTATVSCSTAESVDPYKGSNLSSRIAGYRSPSRGGGLVQLDVKNSTLVTDQMLENLVETSAFTLEILNVSYCPSISDRGLGYLVSKLGRQLTKIEVWGCAQITDEFFDGHDRVEDRTLQIIGAWMKKSGTGTLR